MDGRISLRFPVSGDRFDAEVFERHFVGEHFVFGGYGAGDSGGFAHGDGVSGDAIGAVGDEASADISPRDDIGSHRLSFHESGRRF